ncbi:MAG: hypothetical protein QOF66_6091 [Mycobacterium sp.]|nr:hypothetical protein [Mycobacterium sp.]
MVRETVTVTVHADATTPLTSTAAPAPSSVFSGNGVWAVGDQPSGGLQHSLPPGRYTFTVTPGGYGAGSVMRCSSVVCGLSYAENTLSIDNATSPDYSSVIDITPTDVAVWLQNATLTRVP